MSVSSASGRATPCATRSDSQAPRARGPTAAVVGAAAGAGRAGAFSEGGGRLPPDADLAAARVAVAVTACPHVLPHRSAARQADEQHEAARDQPDPTTPHTARPP